jgi:type II restriction enzyme
MLCIEKLNKKVFHLKELDIFLDELQLKYPDNNHVKDKIRQKIQVLRDN